MAAKAFIKSIAAMGRSYAAFKVNLFANKR